MEMIQRTLGVKLKKAATQYPVVTLTGPRQSGKTTLVNLIPRFYDPSKGVVTIDGIDLRDVCFTSLTWDRGENGLALM